MTPKRFLMGLFAVATSLGASSCAADSPLGLDGLDASGVWRATLEGTVFNNEDGTGQRTTLTLTLSQSGTEVTGNYSINDTRGRTATASVSGTIQANTVRFSGPDVDPQCEQRTVSGLGEILGVGSGSTMTVRSTAPGTQACHALSVDLIYTKQ